MHCNAKTTNRTVFSGSRHARTLSLLSPEPVTGSFPSALSQDRETPAGALDTSRRSDSQRVSHKRVMSGEMQRSKSYDTNGDLDMSREVLMRAGRQMATDFKDGLWTFLEDLRQVTVGEEVSTAGRVRQTRPELSSGSKGCKEKRPRTTAPSPKQAQQGKRTAQVQKAQSGVNSSEIVGEPSPKDSAVGFDDQARQTDIDVEIHVQDSPITRKTPRRRSLAHTTNNRLSLRRPDDSDAWDTWDSPQVQAPAEEEEGTQRSNDGQRPLHIKDLLDNACEQDIKRDPIPWPALTKLAPSNLRRTASHLMSEWEKSISPHNEARGMTLGDDYFDGTNTMPISPKVD